MVRERYQVLLQRLLRADMFNPTLVGGPSSGTVFKLTPIDSLLGKSGSMTLFGMLRATEAGGHLIEDLTASVPLDLSGASVTSGFLTEGCFVIAEGHVIDGVFRARVIGHPPAEPRELSRAALGKVDLFGARWADVAQEELHAAEVEDEAAFFVLLSDVHLDNPKVMRGLRGLLRGFVEAEAIPTMIVLMGNFMARPMGHDSHAAERFTALFDALGDLVAEFPDVVEQTHFLVVPGPRDPSLGAAMPRPRIPPLFTAGFEAKVPNSTFSSSVVRVRFYTQEIVLSRFDLLSEMRRNCLLEPSEETTDASEHLIKTIIDEGHLAPLPLYSCPIYWSYDHALR